jgi:Uri superfamily endonuclease
MSRSDRPDLREALGPRFDFVDGSAPAEPGAYALLQYLGAPLSFALRGNTINLEIGWYVYAGSANGAGGLRGRLRHHLRRGKRPHWHVDHLTNAADRIDVAVGIGRSECEIVRRLVASGRFRVPHPGFGSSDCRDCSSHLLYYRA